MENYKPDFVCSKKNEMGGNRCTGSQNNSRSNSCEMKHEDALVECRQGEVFCGDRLVPSVSVKIFWKVDQFARTVLCLYMEDVEAVVGPIASSHHVDRMWNGRRFEAARSMF